MKNIFSQSKYYAFTVMISNLAVITKPCHESHQYRFRSIEIAMMKEKVHIFETIYTLYHLL